MEQKLSDRVLDVLTKVWENDEAKEQALRDVLSEEQNPNQELIDAVAEGIREGLKKPEPEPEPSLSEMMYPEMHKMMNEPPRLFDPNKTPIEILYPSMFPKKGDK